MKKLAIVTPVYNTSRYIDEFMDSLLSQSFRDFDLYIVDDGSEDGTASKIKKFLTDSRIRFYRKKNEGVSSARNYALDKVFSSTEEYKYIYFCDSDDKLEQECLTKVISACESQNADYALFSVMYWYKNKKEVYIGNIRKTTAINDDEITKQYFRYGRKWYKESFTEGFLNNKIFRSSLVKKYRFDENLKRAEDFDYFLRVSNNLKKGVIVPDAWYLYRKRKSSLTSTVRETGDIDVFIKNKDFIKEKNFHIVRSMQHKFVRGVYTSYCLAIINGDKKRIAELKSIYSEFKIQVIPLLKDIKMIFLLSLPDVVFKRFVGWRNNISGKLNDKLYFE